MNKKIDELYKERFEKYEVNTSADLWSKLEKNPKWTQHLQRQKTRQLYIYAAIFVAAAGLTTALIVHKQLPVDSESFEIVDTSFVEESVAEPVAPAAAVTAAEPVEDDTILKDKDNKKENVADTESAVNNSVTNNSTTATPVTSESAPVTNVSAKETHKNNAEESKTTKSKSSKSKSTDKNQKNVSKDKSSKNNPTEPVSPEIPQESSYESPFSIPNAFTPNGDGLNDVFAPQTAAEISSYQLEIYTTGGQRLFVSRDLSYGWNGEYQGGLMNGGSYIYVVRHKDTSGKEHIDKGQLLLIR